MLTSVVTGASSGIGAELSLNLLKNGYKVVMISRSYNKMKEIIPKEYMDNTHVIKCDLTNDLDCLNACNNANEYLDNKLDLLVNNAGGSIINTTLSNTDIDTWNWHFKLNVTSTFLLSKYFTPSLANAKGNIVNISSIASHKPFIQQMPYCVSKAALDQLTQCMAIELGNQGIRVNGIRPSTLKTNFRLNAGASMDEANKFYNHPGWKDLHLNINSVGTTQNVIDLIMFLADNNKASWITGQNIDIDGGFTLQTPKLK
mmetsp:Transcript_107238/g.130851  ORF Transcript_107238/g.130851 Transcript_107238/m.130851 type:complete len:258 (+) Transcript_107238:108-881(+)